MPIHRVAWHRMHPQPMRTKRCSVKPFRTLDSLGFSLGGYLLPRKPFPTHRKKLNDSVLARSKHYLFPSNERQTEQTAKCQVNGLQRATWGKGPAGWPHLSERLVTLKLGK
jgi:hypothetical protein